MSTWVTNRTRGGTIVAVGLRGSVTARGKQGRWTPASTGTLNWLSGVLVGDGGEGLAVGAHGTILRLGRILQQDKEK